MSKLWFEGKNLAVDIVVLCGDKVLLIQRKDTGQWALPGGFVDTASGENFDSAAMRELKEESGLSTLIAPYDMFYRGKVTDPRNTKTRWVETTAFRVNYDKSMGTPVAGDDAEEVRWMEILACPLLGMYGSHLRLIEMAVKGI